MDSKKILVPAALLLTFAIGATAQPTSPKKPAPPKKQAKQQPPKTHMAPGGFGYGAPRGARMRAAGPDLNLTDAQKKKLQAIRQADRKAMQSIMSDSKLSDQQKREKMMALMKQSRTKTDAVLNPEQRKKLSEWRKQHPRPNGQVQGTPPAPAKPTRKR